MCCCTWYLCQQQQCLHVGCQAQHATGRYALDGGSVCALADCCSCCARVHMKAPAPTLADRLAVWSRLH